MKSKSHGKIFFMILIAIILSIFISGQVYAGPMIKSSLATKFGPDITDDMLRVMLDAFIPPQNAQSSLLIFTECYGGDKMDDFEGRPGTTVLSATSPCQPAYYGGYHDDAARALRPGEGRTSNDVHNAGVAGKDSQENPQQQGPGCSLEPTMPDGPIQSRHVLVYAGQPNNLDNADRDNIQDNFAGQANTTVTTVGASGAADDYDYPGSLGGLRDALRQIGANMNPNEQFILFVTDHGDKGVYDTPICEYECFTPLPLILPETTYQEMLEDQDNIPVITLFSQSNVLPPPIQVFLNNQIFPWVVFEYPIDLDGDGAMQGPLEGWMAVIDIDEDAIDPTGNIITVVPIGEPVQISEIGLSTGPMSRKPMCGDADNNSVVDIFDALLIAEYDAGLKSASEIPGYQSCDVDNNGEVNIFDALEIAKFDAGLIAILCTL